MNKTVLPILLLAVFSLLLIGITLFCGGMGLCRLLGLYGGMEYCCLGTLAVINLLMIYKVCKLYFAYPKAILLLIGVECSSILLWLAFICLDQNQLEGQITNYLLKVVGLDGFTGDERGLNVFAVLCGIAYPLIGIGCVFIGLRFINRLVKQYED